MIEQQIGHHEEETHPEPATEPRRVWDWVAVLAGAGTLIFISAQLHSALADVHMIT